MAFREAVLLTADLFYQDGGARVVIWDYALRCPLEDSSQVLPRGLERRIGRKV